LEKKQYDPAAQGFELYLEKFPKGETADLAGYYLGQARFAQERWEDAARAFAVVLDRFPKSEVTPGSRLRYAQCLLKMKTHTDEAKRYLESIPADFPKSPEAVKAKELLKTLGGKKG
ncbi:MAG: tetratricopeptide repeat protein, partial [Elusimicrobia bacterium]|nr:tetratricopeptide repeat protein [Elusimicrobiota bacterium]